MDEHQGGDQRGLPVLAGDGEDGAANAPTVVQPVGLVDVADEPLLPGSKFERAAGAFARWNR